MNSHPLLKRTFAALAGVAVDEIRDLTVAHLDQMAGGLHQRLADHPHIINGKPLSEPLPEPLTKSVTPIASGSHNRTSASSLVAGALIGIGVAIWFTKKR
jgi:hypothetical protein